jgi:hypothetical protein
MRTTAKCRIKSCGKVRPLEEMRPFKIGKVHGYKCRDHDNHQGYFDARKTTAE